jgi:hypothetical protein
VSTPDRFPGTREEEALVIKPSASPPTIVGEVRLVSGDVLIRDNVGVYNPRAGASLLGRAIFKSDGGLIFTSEGDVVIKQVA